MSRFTQFLSSFVGHLLLTFASILALYTLLGFFLVPHLAQRQIQKIVQEKLSVTPHIQKITFNPFTFEMSIANFILPNSTQSEKSRLQFAKLSVNLDIFPLLKKEIHFQSIDLEKADGQLVIFKDRSTNWHMKESPSEKKDKSKAPSKWVLKIEHIRLDESQFDFLDETHLRPLDLPLGPVSLRASNISTSFGSESSLDNLEFSVGDKGHIKLAGRFDVKPVKADIQIEMSDAPMESLTAYLSDKTYLLLKQATANVAGNLKYEDGQMSFTGNSSIHNLRLEQEKSDEPVLTWQNMDLQGVKVQYKPLSIHVDDVLIEKPNTQIILNSDGTLNFKTLMRPTNGQQNPESKNTPSVEEKSGSPENKSMDMVVSKVRIKQGELDYSDLQIRPHFSAHVHNLDGVIGPIAYGTSEKINVELTGNVEAYGTFKGHGFVILREKWPDLNLDMNFHNIELTTFTPYSGRFAGYEISKGKLFLDINYTLVNQRIKGKNHILLDQLTLGKKIESEKATHLPVKFALALMKDRKGQIDFKLPVEGDLGSPSFSWSNLIWTAVENLFVKIITSPFDFIAGLFGGGAELQTIYFSPGASTLAVEEQSKVQSVAKALTERPDLALEIKGEYQEQDIDEFRKTKLNSRLESLLKSHKNDRSAALHSLAKSTLKADELKALEKSPDDDIEKKLLSTMPVTNEELKSLGIARGQAVFSSLTASQIDAQRIYLLSSGKSEDNKNPHASLNLKEK